MQRILPSPVSAGARTEIDGASPPCQCCCWCWWRWSSTLFGFIGSGLFNPFSAPACKMSGLKDARTRLQTVYFPVLYNYLHSMLCVLIKVFSRASAKTETKRLKGFRFRTVIIVFKWHHGSGEGVKIGVYCSLRSRFWGTDSKRQVADTFVRNVTHVLVDRRSSDQRQPTWWMTT